MKKPTSPYKTLGIRLKRARQKSAQTISEVSGAVEIEETQLSKIESGQVKPSPLVLEALSAHFNLPDEETIKLMDLAGYTLDEPAAKDSTDIDNGLTKTIIMLLSHDNKVLYTDGLDIHYDSSGVLLNFKQSAGQSKPTSVAKLGMSYEQAAQVHKTLTKVLLHAKYLKGPKSLPKSSDK